MLSIAIIDSNKFYMDALRTVLNQYFSNRNTQVIFTEPDCNSLGRADMVFQAIEQEAHHLDILPFLGGNFMGVIFPIFEYEDKKTLYSQRHTCFQELPIIYRQDSPSTVIKKVRKKMSLTDEIDIKDPKKVMRKKCYMCYKNKMTKNETEVLELINQEYSLTAIADILNKSVKTIHAQKKSAMNKLNITSNIELYAFLRKNWKLLEYYKYTLS